MFNDLKTCHGFYIISGTISFYAALIEVLPKSDQKSGGRERISCYQKVKAFDDINPENRFPEKKKKKIIRHTLLFDVPK